MQYSFDDARANLPCNNLPKFLYLMPFTGDTLLKFESFTFSHSGYFSDSYLRAVELIACAAATLVARYVFLCNSSLLHTRSPTTMHACQNPLLPSSKKPRREAPCSPTRPELGCAATCMSKS